MDVVGADEVLQVPAEASDQLNMVVFSEEIDKKLEQLPKQVLSVEPFAMRTSAGKGDVGSGW